MEEKVSLPIKTKIAAWWMIIYGSLGGISTLVDLCDEIRMHVLIPYLLYLAQFIFFSLLPFFSGMFLLKKKRWGWWFSVIIVLFLMLSSFLIFFEPGTVLGVVAYLFNFTDLGEILFFGLIVVVFHFAISLIVLFLLLLDRKNFWKVAK